MSTDPTRVAVVGATGYAGAELVRLLADHPGARLAAVTSERDAGRPLGSVHPTLADTGLELESADVSSVAAKAEFAFVALPHGTSAPMVAGLLERGLKVVDVGADFRLRDRALYEAWYGEHTQPELLDEAVYGLTEYAREAVAAARLVANPGCYPTGALFALLPLGDRLRGPVVVDSKSGTSGAGRAAKTEQLFAEVTENVRPYGVARHRHQPEIEFHLQAVGAAAADVLFTPHLVPVARGLLSTCYVDVDPGVDVAGLVAERYRDEAFVTVCEDGRMPEPRNVRGTNRVEVAAVRHGDSGRWVVVSAIDNLGKGAAGQAVQNFNLMTGRPEDAGLRLRAALP